MTAVSIWMRSGDSTGVFCDRFSIWMRSRDGTGVFCDRFSIWIKSGDGTGVHYDRFSMLMSFKQTILASSVRPFTHAVRVWMR